MNEKERQGLNEIKELLNYSIMSIRSIAKRLSPLALEGLGLQTVLEELLGQLDAKNEINY